MTVVNAIQMLKNAQAGSYAVGSFSPRNNLLIQAILDAAENQCSPVMVQISANEFHWFDITPREFASAFYKIANEYTIPIALHLDHTRDLNTIKEAIEAGFTSVMIDASTKTLDENIEITRQVVEFAHSRNVSVEAELGQIGGADKLETGSDAELYTKVDEAALFCDETSVDMLAVSVGTAHGVYKVQNPEIQFQLITQLNDVCGIPLVLHGGSGLSSETINEAIRCGIAKINIATDLELAFHSAIGRTERQVNSLNSSLSNEMKRASLAAVQSVVEDRMYRYFHSSGKA